MNSENIMQSKRIIHITYELYPKNLGGIGIFVFMLLNEISKILIDCKISVLVPTRDINLENRFENSNVSIISISNCYINNKLNLKLFSEKVKNYLDLEENKNSIIHFHDITLFHFLRNYRNVVYTFHKDDGISVSSEKKISASIHFSKISQRKHIIPAEKKYVIPNGLPINKRKAVVAYIGRISAEKGFDKFLNYVNKSKIDNKYITIGSEDFIHKKIISLGILDNFKVNEQIEKIDYLIVPSIKEEFGLVILEALKKNKKIIISNLQQLHELFSDFKNVFFIDFKKNNYVEKIDNFLQKDFYDFQNKINRFSIENIATKYIGVYNEI